MSGVNTNGTTATVVDKDLEAQRAYVKQVETSGFEFGLTVAAAFVRGIRDIGYKHTGTALDELIDNAMQAGAENIEVLYEYDQFSNAKPIAIAVLDDGHGMDPAMIRLAGIWGGTHRENDRHGFGRYGYGLPSSCVSQGRRFSIYSMVEDGQWHRLTLDIDDISDGQYTDERGRIIVPEPVPARPPMWIQKHIDNSYDNFPHGTVVVIEKLDRHTWKTTTGLNTNLRQHFGVVYRNFLREVHLFVDGQEVEPVDPLFTTPGMRFYDLDDDRAEALAPMFIDVKERDTKQPAGTLKVRFAYMPPTFLREKKDVKRGANNARFPIRKEYNGIIFLRAGRQIDVATRVPASPEFEDGFSVRNNDRYWGVEVDFPPTLDEEFSVTTSKQQIVPSDRIWGILREQGVFKAIKEFRDRYEREAKKFAHDLERRKDEQRASEMAMGQSAKYKTRKPGGDTVEREREHRERLEEEARKRSQQSGVPFPAVLGELESETQGQPYKVVLETLPGAPFFRVQQVGGQKQLLINMAHRFYTDVYAHPDATRHMQDSLETVLFVIGDSELDASDDRRNFYETERSEWSRLLSVTLDRLSRITNHDDFEYDPADSVQHTATVND